MKPFRTTRRGKLRASYMLIHDSMGQVISRRLDGAGHTGRASPIRIYSDGHWIAKDLGCGYVVRVKPREARQ